MSEEKQKTSNALEIDPDDLMRYGRLDAQEQIVGLQVFHDRNTWVLARLVLSAALTVAALGAASVLMSVTH
jgi:hypothetical protein